MARPSRMISGTTFDQETVLVDGYHYHNCCFNQCKIVFRATEPVKFDGCVFNECIWEFDGPAENALLYLSALYNGLGEGGKELVEGVFESIRQGAVEQGILTMQPALHR